MANILTYAQEYRQKSFDEEPFNIVDSLILCQISYYDYEDSGLKKIFFNKKISEYFREKAENDSEILIKGMLTASEDEKLIPVLAQGGRHGDMRACGYVEEFCAEAEKQFAAITFELEKGLYYIAFRGTDASVVGWKEDFALSFQEEIPAQRAALRYAEEMMLRYPGRFYIGGHSKGGNLAVYAAMNLPEALQRRIKQVYSFDGPGFLREVYEKSRHENIKSIVCKIIPQSSVVGMILEEHADYKVVSSSAELHMQHNPYTWQVQGKEFVYLDSEDSFSRLVKRSLDGWLDDLDLGERKRIINTIFGVLYDTGITSFYELTEQPREKLKRVLKCISNVNPEEKRFVIIVVKRFLGIASEELRHAAKEETALQFEKIVMLLEKRIAKLDSEQ